MFQGDVPETELLRVRTERDELKAALLGAERRLEDAQDSVKALSTERDHLKMLLKVSLFQDDLITPYRLKPLHRCSRSFRLMRNCGWQRPQMCHLI